MKWLSDRVREAFARFPWPSPKRSYDYACWSTVVPIIALLIIGIYPCNSEWVHEYLWEIKSGPTLLIFSMILLLINFAWITDIAIVSRRTVRGFHPLFLFSMVMAFATALLVVLHWAGNDDFRPDPQPIIFFIFVAVVFLYYAFFRPPLAPIAIAVAAPGNEQASGGERDDAS